MPTVRLLTREDVIQRLLLEEVQQKPSREVSNCALKKQVRYQAALSLYFNDCSVLMLFIVFLETLSASL